MTTSKRWRWNKRKNACNHLFSSSFSFKNWHSAKLFQTEITRTSNSETKLIISFTLISIFVLRINDPCKSMKRLCIYNILQSFRLPSEIFVLFVLIHENSFCRRLKNLKLNELTFWLSVFLTFYSYYYLYFIWYASFIERKQRASGGWKKVCPDTRAIKHINTERSNTQCVQLKCLNSSYIPFVPLNLKVNEEQKSSK